ncbi:hypothetical protein BX666DRAFT_2121150 [Dichotomocladium elegans]|nr:hypothetical protein BX666DRAFT_2121150 [Dichotomocladium elegans]
MTQIRLYDLELSAIPAQFWSPNTCKTRFALNFKGIPYETEWVVFDQVQGVVSSVVKSDARATVPAIVDIAHNNFAIQDSWEIAQYLEKAYADTPSLFNGQIGIHQFFLEYCTEKLLPHLVCLCFMEIHRRATPQKTQDWFRETMESRNKMTLEEMASNPDVLAKNVTEALVLIGRVLVVHPFITGEKAGYADLVLAAYFQMVDVLRPELFKSLILNDTNAGHALTAWWKRMDKYRHPSV